VSPVIDLTNTQRAADLDEDALRRYTAWIMERVGRLRPEFRWTELSLVLTDDRIRELNREWFGKDLVTDVISFAYPAAEEGGGDSGEIIVNVAQALEEGRLRKSPDDELALYIAHGCDHLAGALDDTPARKRAMLRRENAWVAQARRRHLLGPFFL
jgi:rRNA maturation RNase YbeY